MATKRTQVACFDVQAISNKREGGKGSLVEEWKVHLDRTGEAHKLREEEWIASLTKDQAVTIAWYNMLPFVEQVKLLELVHSVLAGEEVEHEGKPDVGHSEEGKQELRVTLAEHLLG